MKQTVWLFVVKYTLEVGWQKHYLKRYFPSATLVDIGWMPNKITMHSSYLIQCRTYDLRNLFTMVCDVWVGLWLPLRWETSRHKAMETYLVYTFIWWLMFCKRHMCSNSFQLRIERRPVCVHRWRGKSMKLARKYICKRQQSRSYRINANRSSINTTFSHTIYVKCKFFLISC